MKVDFITIDRREICYVKCGGVLKGIVVRDSGGFYFEHYKLDDRPLNKPYYTRLENCKDATEKMLVKAKLRAEAARPKGHKPKRLKYSL